MRTNRPEGLTMNQQHEHSPQFDRTVCGLCGAAGDYCETCGVDLTKHTCDAKAAYNLGSTLPTGLLLVRNATGKPIPLYPAATED